MIDIIHIDEWVKLPDTDFKSGDQFIVIETLPCLDGVVAYKAKRVKDGKVFTADQNVFIYVHNYVYCGVKMSEEIFVERLDWDKIHVELVAYRHSEDYKFCAGEGITCEINEIDRKSVV